MQKAHTLGNCAAAPHPALPSISLVTCSYQQGRYLEQTTQSVLEQGYPRLEYLVIDGGSSDGSVGILERRAAGELR
jgi:glycosyltransferase involved in cell wall biosynthesis